MAAPTFTVTVNTVAKVLTMVDDSNYGSEYYLDDGTEKYRFTVKHTIPKAGGSGESHLARLDCERYDAEGQLVAITSAWTVIRTDVGIQDSTWSDNITQALVDALSDTVIDKLVGRVSEL